MNAKIKPLGLFHSYIIYFSAALLMFVLTKYAIPYLSYRTGQETILFWFIVAGLGIFTPLIVTGVLLLKSEGYRLINNNGTVTFQETYKTGCSLEHWWISSGNGY